MLTKGEVIAIMADVDYRGWNFIVGVMNDGCYIQASFEAVNWDVQLGRKWYLSPHATRSEVVQTALKAVLTAEEHEAREHFRYKGQTIFFPHLDVDEMAEIRKAAMEDRREA